MSKPVQTYAAKQVNEMEPFQCRVCGATTYTEIFTAKVVEDVSQDCDQIVQTEKCELGVGFMCDGCSITFQSVEKFSNLQK